MPGKPTRPRDFIHFRFLTEMCTWIRCASHHTCYQQIGSPEYAAGILERARHGAADPETLRTSAVVLPACYEARLQKKVARAEPKVRTALLFLHCIAVPLAEFSFAIGMAGILQGFRKAAGQFVGSTFTPHAEKVIHRVFCPSMLEQYESTRIGRLQAASGAEATTKIGNMTWTLISTWVDTLPMRLGHARSEFSSLAVCSL